MAKELPYFKFFPGEWLKGDITICSIEAQGLFINICVYYWMRDCNMSLTNVQQRFNNYEIELKELEREGLINIDEDENIIINFLDEQMSEFAEISKKRSDAGRASAEKRKGNKCSTPVQQKPNNKEKRREDKDKDKEINIVFDVFWNLYDKKKDRPKCERKWENLKDRERELVISYIPAYKESTQDKQYRKDPATFLNNRSWENEILITAEEGKTITYNELCDLSTLHGVHIWDEYECIKPGDKRTPAIFKKK